MRQLADPAPTNHGVRVELRLEPQRQPDALPTEAEYPSTPPFDATYSARLYLNSTDAPPLLGEIRVRGRAIELELDGSIPDWLRDWLTNLLRVVARGAPPWPRRLTRWRAGEN